VQALFKQIFSGLKHFNTVAINSKVVKYLFLFC
jgi:hypothetical protein